MAFVSKHADWLLCLVLAVLFVLWPQLDLKFSALFYDAQLQTWTYGKHPINESIYWLFRYMPHFLLPLMLLTLLTSFFRGGMSPTLRKPWLFLLLVLLIGPGLLVHNVFKPTFDRERPRAVAEFDGRGQFTPAFVINEACPRSCASFVSGHAAMAFFFMSLAWIFRRRAWLWWGIGAGVVMSIVRIMQGGHFLSDTVFAGFVVYFTCRLLSYWFFGYSRIRPS